MFAYKDRGKNIILTNNITWWNTFNISETETTFVHLINQKRLVVYLAGKLNSERIILHALLPRLVYVHLPYTKWISTSLYIRQHQKTYKNYIQHFTTLSAKLNVFEIRRRLSNSTVKSSLMLSKVVRILEEGKWALLCTLFIFVLFAHDIVSTKQKINCVHRPSSHVSRTWIQPVAFGASVDDSVRYCIHHSSN